MGDQISEAPARLSGANTVDQTREGVPLNEPKTKAERQGHVLRVLLDHAVRSQAELAELLGSEGLELSQATLSRDLAEIGVVRLRTTDGNLVYAVPGEDAEGGQPTVTTVGRFGAMLQRLAQGFLVSAESSANLVLVRTPPGAAQYLASAIDHACLRSVLGTVAGDDSILIITDEQQRAEDLTVQLLNLAKRDGREPESPSVPRDG